MDVRSDFPRARLATVVLGTSMLRWLFQKRKDNFLFRLRHNFNPNLSDFEDMYDLCTKGLIENLEPSDGWITCFVNPKDTTLGDDIKRLYVLINTFRTMETDLQQYKSQHDQICRMLNYIIMRFYGSEGKNFTTVFKYIMRKCDVDEIEKDLDAILKKSDDAKNIPQKYECASQTSKLYPYVERVDKHSFMKKRVEVTADASYESKNITNEGGSYRSYRKSTANRDETTLSRQDESKIKDEQMESDNGNLKFLKTQIYFDFVPPPLNNFEYSMNKLSNIEKCLCRLRPGRCPEPMLSKYMSFTFVHGSHIDLKHASMALFNAEPEEKENEDNNSGIAVVYLDKEITFELLENATKSTRTLKITPENKYIFIAVHSEQLLQDCIRLKSILKPILGEQLKIQDANGKMMKLYKSFEWVQTQAFRDIAKRIQDFKDNYGDDEKLRSIEKRLLKLHLEDDENESCRIKEKTMWSSSTFSWLMDQGLQGYTMENSILILCFKRSLTSREITKSMLPNEICQRFPNLKIIQFKKSLFTPYHDVKGGDKLHPSQHIADSYGTVGMFGAICQCGRPPRTCCISSPHVISSGTTAYILDAAVGLGSCIWPPVVDNNTINVEDISVICLQQNSINIRRLVKEQITLFRGDRRDLKRRTVYKFGATTSKTVGFIRDAEFVLTIGDPVRVFLIEPEDAEDNNSRFAQPGDSGAIVLTKIGQDVVALSMIFGGDVTLEGFAQNNSIAVDLQQAIQRFEARNQGLNIQLDTL